MLVLKPIVPSGFWLNDSKAWNPLLVTWLHLLPRCYDDHMHEYNSLIQCDHHPIIPVSSRRIQSLQVQDGVRQSIVRQENWPRRRIASSISAATWWVEDVISFKCKDYYDWIVAQLIDWLIAFVISSNLRSSEYNRLVEVLKQKRQSCSCICHRVCAVQHNKARVCGVLIHDDLGQLDPLVHVLQSEETEAVNVPWNTNNSVWKLLWLSYWKG